MTKEIPDYQKCYICGGELPPNNLGYRLAFGNAKHDCIVVFEEKVKILTEQNKVLQGAVAVIHEQAEILGKKLKEACSIGTIAAETSKILAEFIEDEGLGVSFVVWKEKKGVDNPFIDNFIITNDKRFGRNYNEQ